MVRDGLSRVLRATGVAVILAPWLWSAWVAVHYWQMLAKFSRAHEAPDGLGVGTGLLLGFAVVEIWCGSALGVALLAIGAAVARRSPPRESGPRPSP